VFVMEQDYSVLFSALYSFLVRYHHIVHYTSHYLSSNSVLSYEQYDSMLYSALSYGLYALLCVHMCVCVLCVHETYRVLCQVLHLFLRANFPFARLLGCLRGWAFLSGSGFWGQRAFGPYLACGGMGWIVRRHHRACWSEGCIISAVGRAGAWGIFRAGIICCATYLTFSLLHHANSLPLCLCLVPVLYPLFQQCSFLLLCLHVFVVMTVSRCCHDCVWVFHCLQLLFLAVFD
jgi:hypothetical protein